MAHEKFPIRHACSWFRWLSCMFFKADMQYWKQNERGLDLAQPIMKKKQKTIVYIVPSHLILMRYKNNNSEYQAIQ